MFYRNLILNKLNRSANKSAWFHTDCDAMMKAADDLEKEGLIKQAGSGRGEVRYVLVTK